MACHAAQEGTKGHPEGCNSTVSHLQRARRQQYPVAEGCSLTVSMLFRKKKVLPQLGQVRQAATLLSIEIGMGAVSTGRL